MHIRPIKTAKDHRRALADLTALLETAPAPDSEAAEKAEVLATLIEEYENERFPKELPSPVEAIRFRMDQMNLAQKDLVPYIGSASKVSEVLNGKRPLSLSMIRALHRHLGIPAEVLIQESNERERVTESDSFPLKEMHKRGYFQGAPDRYVEFKRQAGQWLDRFFGDAGVRETAPAYARSTAHYRSAKQIRPGAFLAWQAQVLRKARARPTSAYREGTVDKAFLRRVADLSVLDDAPLLAREFLEKHGIRFVIEPHLPRTYLDGAALLSPEGYPVIGLSLRHDRLDNFWFNLLHELVHVGWHLDKGCTAFFDVLDAPAAEDELEAEADGKAADALIPPEDWRFADVRVNPHPESVRVFARAIGRHPAIVAGRIRMETGNYRLLSHLVGNGRVRELFK